MKTFTRRMNGIKKEIAKLGHELFAFVCLIMLSSVEVLFLSIFVKIHDPVHDKLDHSPLCPLKIAIVIMGLSFLLLNVLMVLAFVINHSVSTIRSLRSAISKKPQARRKATRSQKQEKQDHLNICAGSTSVFITHTVGGGPAVVDVSSLRFPGATQVRSQGMVGSDKDLKSNGPRMLPGSPARASRNTPDQDA